MSMTGRSLTAQVEQNVPLECNTEVSIVTGLNSTALRLIESVVLLTKLIGIVTPLILSIIVVVALR